MVALAVWADYCFRVRKAILENSARPSWRLMFPSGWGQFGWVYWPSRPIIYIIFVSFPTTPISSQSNIWVKRYDQNTRGCPDSLTGLPDGKLQLPFQNSTESFHNKAASERCCPNVRTVVLRLHVISIIRLWASRPWRLMSGLLN
jgi:hypothetical protein